MIYEWSLLHIFYNIQKFPVWSSPVSQNALRLWDHGGSNPREKPGTSNTKTEQWLIYPGNLKAVDNLHSFYDLPNWCCE